MKNIKKLLPILLTALILLTVSSCSANNERYTNGVYSAEADEFAASGWKETVEITIENNKLVRIDWDAVYKDDSIPIRKKQYSKSGLYGMMAAGAIAEWYDQAVAAEQYVLENGIDALNLTDGGYSDSVSGCTIHVSEFKQLLQQCLDIANK